MLMRQTAAIEPASASRISGLHHGRFKLMPIITAAQREEVHRLRYQIYCIEYPYENPTQFADGLEHDEFDSHSDHRLIYDHHTEQAIGTVRLVLPLKDSLDLSFPIQSICCHPLLWDYTILKGAAEVSRFAISKSVRSHLHAGTHHDFSSSMLTIMLLKGVIQMSREHGISDLFAVMEPSLLRLLASRFAFHFNPIGPMVDYHGMRQPCHANLNRLLERTRRENFAVWSFITATDHHA